MPSPHELVIRFGRPFDVTMPGKNFLASVCEVTVPFLDRDSAEAAQREITVSVRPVRDAGAEDYRPVVPGEVVREPAEIAPASSWRPVVKCLNCGRPVHQVRKRDIHLGATQARGRTTATGWDHWGFWQGVRCPGALTGAEPGGEFTEEEYWAWVDKQIAGRVITGPAGIEQGEL